jgi:arylsulfatase A-like enzyme
MINTFKKHLILCFGLAAACSVYAGDRPNILLLVGDDMAFGDIGPYGSEIETPALDKFAKEGIKFTNFRATPVCSVTRSELLTGANNIQVGLAAFDYAVYPPAKGQPGYEGYLTDNAVTIAQLLQDAGYNTYTTGKWHLGGKPGHGGHGPTKWGFDRSYGIYVGGSNHWNQEVMLPDASDPYTAKTLKAGKIPKPTLEAFHMDDKAVTRPDGVYSNDLYTSNMIDFLKEGHKSKKPFFAYLAFTTAHLPIQAPKELIDKYYDTYYQLGYEGLRKGRYDAMIKNGVIPKDTQYHDGKTDNTGHLVKSWADVPEDQKRIQARVMATYAAMIDSQDQHIAKILDYLESVDELDNTLIIYLTDNGPEGTDLRGTLGNPLLLKWVKANYSEKFEDVGQANANWQIGTTWANSATGVLSWWKGYVGEGGIRVPMIIRPPKGDQFKRHDGQTNAHMSVKDIPATILDYAGVSFPGNTYKGHKVAKATGVSARPFLEGRQDVIRTEDQWTAFELFGNTYVIQGNYKATKIRTGMFGDGQWHLYDILKDPGETTPLEIKDPKRLEKMMGLYAQYAKEMGVYPVEDKWNPYSAISH